MRRTRLIVIVFIGIFVLTDLIYYAFWRSTVSIIGGPFGGLDATGSGRTVRLLVVHGIGKHCVGYAHNLSQGVAKALGLQTGSSSQSFHKIIQALDDKPRQQARTAWLTRIKPPDSHTPLKEVLNQQQTEIPPEAWPLMDENCDLIHNSGYTNSMEDYNGLENVQIQTCKAIHNHKTENGMDCQAIKLSFKDPAPVEPGFEPPPGKMPSFILGFVRMHNYFGQNPQVPSLRVYELTWHPSTRSVKDWYLRYDMSSTGWWLNARWWLNRELKSAIVNDSLSDAVLYLGIYRPLIQYVILQGFCKLISDEKDAQGEDFDCLRDTNNVLLGDEFSRDNDLAIITHSLGTRIVFDVLGGLGHDDFFHKLTKDLREKNVCFRQACVTCETASAYSVPKHII